MFANETADTRTDARVPSPRSAANVPSEVWGCKRKPLSTHGKSGARRRFPAIRAIALQKKDAPKGSAVRVQPASRQGRLRVGFAGTITRTQCVGGGRNLHIEPFSAHVSIQVPMVAQPDLRHRRDERIARGWAPDRTRHEARRHPRHHRDDAGHRASVAVVESDARLPVSLLAHAVQGLAGRHPHGKRLLCERVAEHILGERA